MTFAVMQPYLFPYLGYYQLVSAVDKFVFYDDVTFIKGGYINRNNILSNGKAQRFTVPVPGMSSNKLINELCFDKNTKKIIKSIEQNYKKAPYFEYVFPLIESVLNSEIRTLEHVCSKSITRVFEYLGIKKDFYLSSELEYNRKLNSAKKLIEIAKNLQETKYINSPGGIELYSKTHFMNHDIELLFIKMKELSYVQNQDDFVPNLSMIDVLMWNDKLKVKCMLSQYDLF